MAIWDHVAGVTGREKDMSKEARREVAYRYTPTSNKHSNVCREDQVKRRSERHSLAPLTSCNIVLTDHAICRDVFAPNLHRNGGKLVIY